MNAKSVETNKRLTKESQDVITTSKCFVCGKPAKAKYAHIQVERPDGNPGCGHPPSTPINSKLLHDKAVLDARMCNEPYCGCLDVRETKKEKIKMKIEVSKTNRGFAYMEFNDAYDTKCTLQKSSLAEHDCIWFGVHDPIQTKETLLSRMHLTQDQVRDLLPILENFVNTGELAYPEVIELREVVWQQAVREIEELFKDGETHYYSDIADELRLPLKQVVEVCHALELGGLIEEGAKEK